MACALLVVTCAAGSQTVTGDELARVVAVARAVKDGYAVRDWEGGKLPYAWGGGHAADAGPSLGTCRGYHGAVKPCPARRTLGLDCSGLTRWVYRIAFGRDVL